MTILVILAFLAVSIVLMTAFVLVLNGEPRPRHQKR